jgi:hypothetical protein
MGLPVSTNNEKIKDDNMAGPFPLGSKNARETKLISLQDYNGNTFNHNLARRV